MMENKEVILVGKELREAIQEADRIRCPEAREERLKELGIDTIKEPDPFEIVVYENEGLENAREWLDAMCLICLPIWMEQLRTFGIKDSNYWMMVRNEREAKKNE